MRTTIAEVVQTEWLPIVTKRTLAERSANTDSGSGLYLVAVQPIVNFVSACRQIGEAQVVLTACCCSGIGALAPNTVTVSFTALSP
jgi:hypothetical protein